MPPPGPSIMLFLHSAWDGMGNHPRVAHLGNSAEQTAGVLLVGLMQEEARQARPGLKGLSKK